MFERRVDYKVDGKGKSQHEIGHSAQNIKDRQSDEINTQNLEIMIN